MRRLTILTIVIVAAVFGVQSIEAQADLAAAEAAVKAAESAGAPLYAKELYDQAQSRLTLARSNYNSTRSSERNTARLYAAEALRAGQAAEARARLHVLSVEASNLTADVSRFGGTAPTVNVPSPPAISVERGGTSKEKLSVARAALERARSAGAQGVAPDMLKEAESNISTAEKVLKASRNSDTADHLSFVAEMLSRRAEYLALASAPERMLPALRLERSRLAAAAVEAEAEAERARREQLQREAVELRARLADAQAARDAESREAMRLRDQLEADRQARLDASVRLEELRTNYESALSRAGSQSEVEALRRQVEDQQLSLNAIREREIRSEESMRAEITRLQKEVQAERERGDATVAAREQQLLEAQSRLDQLRIDRENADRLRQEAEVRHQRAIMDAQNRLETVQAESAQVRQELASTQAELDRTRAELEKRQKDDAMQAQLNAIAPTRRDERGLIVTLPGLLFDTGKSSLAPGARNLLDRLAEQIKTNDKAAIVIEGHTDSVGSDETNRRLSEARADAVRSYLLAKGVDGNRISTAGRGESVPVATNDTAAGRQQNRRVELIITQ